MIVAEPARVVVERGALLADFGGDELVPWWSFTKTVLAAAALILVRDGRLTLDGPISGKPYTVRQLLQHRAGLGNYGALPDYHDAVARRLPAWPVEELLTRVDADRLIYAPGEGWSYSNIGYLIVRNIIVDAVGEELGRALQRLVLAPLGLRTTRLVRMGDLGDYDPAWVYHGLLLGPLREAALLLDRLMHGVLLPATDVATMVRAHPVGPVSDRPWLTPGYGLGLMTGGVTGGRIIAGHTGGGPGSVIAVYHLLSSRPDRTVAAYAEGDDQGLVERSCIREE
ncbi:CubicO group peptidase, beta-lactamase class C family [Enhydrobacter aerosaccus]|uniref:CubicO group peptidase, beta-lactamase class C family n=1 Tax=Enhydrobacter aerosaccus TaxID=225324 RepID=A0A1T4RIH8_9HYPH|nr:serine hydrolase domain-containing protein [Enhydrobacter aerosaccus]SKA15775.1 CubicO group peptidase, beta-lactamase class C family [Enhydrobacter aerosaccus]